MCSFLKFSSVLRSLTLMAINCYNNIQELSNDNQIHVHGKQLTTTTTTTKTTTSYTCTFNQYQHVYICQKQIKEAFENNLHVWTLNMYMYMYSTCHVLSIVFNGKKELGKRLEGCSWNKTKSKGTMYMYMYTN